MKLDTFKRRLEALVDQGRELVEEYMVDVGDTSETSQKVALTLRLNELATYINGTEQADLKIHEEFFQEFKIFRVSDNTNGFGLRGVWLMNRNGDCFEVGANYLTLESHPNGSVVKLEHREGRISSNGSFSFEIPCSRGKAPAEVVKEVWGGS